MVQVVQAVQVVQVVQVVRIISLDDMHPEKHVVFMVSTIKLSRKVDMSRL